MIVGAAPFAHCVIYNMIVVRCFSKNEKNPPERV